MACAAADSGSDVASDVASGGASPQPRVTPLDGPSPSGPRVASTWGFGDRANAAALEALAAGVEHPVAAAEAGVKVIEADPSVASVGYGGNPNAEGVVEVDACVMRGDTLACGMVAAVQDTMHPVSVARAVMEETIHVLLAGDGATRFAREQGFPAVDMLTDASRKRYQNWLLKGGRPPPEEDHDTIGQIVYADGRFGVACTTSGRAWKLPGRVGDSPIIGAGAYCDDRAGACVGTGVGEEILRVCGSFAVVEAMRHGASADDACREVVGRVAEHMHRTGQREQVALLAMDRQGNVSGCCTTGSFRYVLTGDDGPQTVPSTVVW
jgi:isoaspartyl peptidase/L-asparaginase-like protein (Ntn-hydrolase superfamily)